MLYKNAHGKFLKRKVVGVVVNMWNGNEKVKYFEWLPT